MSETAVEGLYRCPNTWWVPDAVGPLYVVGCGRLFWGEPDKEGLVDCPHCGMWFSAKRPMRVVANITRTETVVYEFGDIGPAIEDEHLVTLIASGMHEPVESRIHEEQIDIVEKVRPS